MDVLLARQYDLICCAMHDPGQGRTPQNRLKAQNAAVRGGVPIALQPATSAARVQASMQHTPGARARRLSWQESPYKAPGRPRERRLSWQEVHMVAGPRPRSQQWEEGEEGGLTESDSGRVSFPEEQALGAWLCWGLGVGVGVGVGGCFVLSVVGVACSSSDNPSFLPPLLNPRD